MNKKLKFSWGHIIAFIALIFISYVSFMGDFYKNGGSFEEAIIKVLIIDVALLTTFIGAQILKGTDRKFGRSIKFERFLILLTPFIFILSMTFNNHFWGVHKQKNNIENLFNSSITDAKIMFEEYNSYSNTRIANYSDVLENIVLNKEADPVTYRKSGFNGSNDQVRKDNYIHTLQLQLLSKNSIELQAEANKWLDKANKDVSVWNAFLIGNIEKISEAIKTWNKLLVEYSIPMLSNEALRDQVIPFDYNKSSSEEALKNLNTLTSIYKAPNKIKIITILVAPFLFLMLLFPYILQERDGKAHHIYFLTPNNLMPDFLMSKQRRELKVHTIEDPTLSYNDFNEKEEFSSENNKNPFEGTF